MPQGTAATTPKWSDVGVAVVVLFLSDAAAHFQRIAHPVGGEQSALGAGAGQGGIGGHRCTVHGDVDGRRIRSLRARAFVPPPGGVRTVNCRARP